MIQLGIDKGMQRAQIIPYGGNQLIDSSTRTNTAAWLNYHQDAVVSRIENEFAKHTNTHPLDGEALQILHYGNGQVRACMSCSNELFLTCLADVQAPQRRIRSG